MSYQLTNYGAIKRLEDGALIPADAGNLDYREFLEWQQAGNTPEPAPAPPVIDAPDFQLFLDTIIASPLYQKVLMQSIASPAVNVAFTTVMGALILAATGRPNLLALQSGFNALLGAMTIEPGDIESLQAIAEAANVDGALSMPT